MGRIRFYRHPLALRSAPFEVRRRSHLELRSALQQAGTLFPLVPCRQFLVSASRLALLDRVFKSVHHLASRLRWIGFLEAMLDPSRLGPASSLLPPA